LRIRNIGSQTIGTSTISLKVSTDVRGYYMTHTDTRIILPDCEIYADIEVPFATEEERMSESGPEIICQFYY